MNKRFLMIAALAAFAGSLQAKVRLPHLLGDGMVIQQDADVRLWGWARPGHPVKVSTSWGSRGVSAKAGPDGKWMVVVKSPAASYTPLTLTFDDGDGPVRVSNVLAGEVWVCAGQSNMEMPVKGFSNCPVDDYNQVVIESAGDRGLRSVKIPGTMSTRPLDDAPCRWIESGPQTVGDISAAGYFFARQVSRALHVPVGLIEANKGGTRVESWLDEDYLKAHTQEPLDSVEMARHYSWDFHRPLLWGNGIFHPILNFTVKGILYYQGCSNVGNPSGQYSQRLIALARQWRRDFKLGDIPFYIVQIAPYKYGTLDGDAGARLGEEQHQASKAIANSGLVCTNDCVYPWETQQIHPAQKRKVGERLAFLALSKTYGMTQLIGESPELKSARVSNDTVYVQLDKLHDGISRYEDLQGFELAGADGVFHKAQAYYYWTQGVIVTCREVSRPCWVSYCFRNFSLGNVANKGGLPLIPFKLQLRQ